MPSPSLFVALVDQLATRHDSGGSGSGTSLTQDVGEHVSRLFLLACDLTTAFQPADLYQHLEGMMTREWAALLYGESLYTSSPASSDAPEPATLSHSSPPPECAPTLIAASGALLGYARTHVTEFETSGVGQEWVDDVCERWQSSVLQLLSAQPPFSAEARTAVCYTVAQLSLLPRNCCEQVLNAACEALETGREDGLNASIATELIGQITSLMVLCKPFQLQGLALEDPAAAAAAATSCKAAASKKDTAPTAGAQAWKRAKLSTQRPAGEGADAGASAFNTAAFGSEAPTLSCSAIPSCYPFPSLERLKELKVSLIQCCLASLGATAAEASTVSSTAVRATRAHHGQQQHRTVPVALICQRVLIPLLLLDGGQGLEQYEHLVVLLIAALFDFLFRHSSLDPRTDFRFSEFLWTVLSSALHRSLTAPEADAGHRANMQLRVEYLLKRIFHPLFRWCTTISGVGSGAGKHRNGAAAEHGDSLSATTWDNFFLVLESLNEYGWHIIEPVMARLDTLIAQLDSRLESGASPCDVVAGLTVGVSAAALHPRWIEMLLLKLILHPNLGVRKVGLRRIWALPQRVLRSLSPSFLFQYVFQSASDPRLCGDIDRVPITASFLDTKAFEGTEVKAVPDVEPLAQEVERFYASLFAHRWTSSDADAVAGRIDALHCMLDTAIKKPPRFTVCTLARVLLAIAQVFLDHGLDAEPVLLDEGVLGRLHRFMRDSVQENVPFWLDVRVTVILFAALTTLAAATASPRRCRLHSAFWRLYCICGPLGESGGHSIASVDACGQYGLVGASVEERFLQHWLVQFSARQQPMRQANFDKAAPSLLEALLDVEGLACRVEALLRAPAEPCSHEVVNIVAVKETFFLVGALTRTGSMRHAELVRAIGDRIATTIASLQTRAYCTAAHVLASAACLVEFQHSVGGAVCAQLWPVNTTLQSMASALHGHVMAALQASVRSICDAAEAPGQLRTVRSLFEGETHDEADTTWALMNITNFDHVRQLMCLLRECSAAYESMSASGAGTASSEEAGQKRLAALLIVSRNAARLLQSELCGYLSVKHEASTAPQARHDEGLDTVAKGRLLFPTALPTCREAPPFSAAASSRCPIAVVLPRDVLEVYVDQLMALPSQRVPSGAVPSALSNLPWSTLLSQQGRYVCNALYVLLLSLTAAEQEDTDTAASNSTRTSPGLVRRVQDYALGQLSECWTVNLASVYDVLLWVSSSNVPEVVDYVTIADGMWEHMREVGARQYTRLAALAFTVLHYVMPHHPDYVKEALLRVLKGEGKDAQTADRDVYFAAITASLQVLHNPANNWPVLRDVVLYAAVFFNTNRDEEENESTVAVTEPLLWTWPEALRQCYPPTTCMAGVGRAMAVATLLWCCYENVAGRAVPLTMELLRMNTCHPLVEEVFRMLVFHCLTVNNMGSVRRLMELYAIRLVEQRPALYTVLSEALGSHSLRPQVCGSYILIACHVLLRQEEAGGADESAAAAAGDEALASGIFASLFPRILQQSTSNQHLLRIISHIGLFNICRRRLARGRPVPPAVAAIYEYVLHAPEHVRLREKHESMLFFDTEAASSPRSLFCVQRKEANTVLAEVLPAAAFERLRFVETEMCCMIGALYPMELLRVHDWCASLRVQERVSVLKGFRGIPHTSTPSDYYVDYTREATELLTRDPMLEASAAAAIARSAAVGAGDEASGADAATANVQKKVSSWWTSEVYNELHPRALRTQKQSIIVVGSLLENPVNIAGLCRCGEIFAIESLVVPEKKVFEHPHFVAAARSAELWIPWEEVMPKDLPGYLEGLRRRGYVVVGIEQTAASVPLEQFSFPERCAVVLGAEGQGVPAPLIPLLDVCVEIPQYGLIRSLNVHVAGAITMYEYTRQHLMAQSHPST
ncbi:SpoU rRNA Methylase family protein [Leishmania donovani]|uniref:SpoU rRNA Methylase family protein n=1 Tax=Leishmania donovani TaxID=5661 RepID=A0A504X7E3_LEIDO|nr:SpoU rRNA Methylase family protein [Leishmania donovani]